MTTPTTHSYAVPGISCDHCKRAIEETVSVTPGVETVIVDVEARTVSVQGGEDVAIVQAISRAGYTVD